MHLCFANGEVSHPCYENSSCFKCICDNKKRMFPDPIKDWAFVNSLCPKGNTLRCPVTRKKKNFSFYLTLFSTYIHFFFGAVSHFETCSHDFCVSFFNTGFNERLQKPEIPEDKNNRRIPPCESNILNVCVCACTLRLNHRIQITLWLFFCAFGYRKNLIAYFLRSKIEYSSFWMPSQFFFSSLIMHLKYWT